MKTFKIILGFLAATYTFCCDQAHNPYLERATQLSTSILSEFKNNSAWYEDTTVYANSEEGKLKFKHDSGDHIVHISVKPKDCGSFQILDKSYFVYQIMSNAFVGGKKNIEYLVLNETEQDRIVADFDQSDEDAYVATVYSQNSEERSPFAQAVSKHIQTFSLKYSIQYAAAKSSR